jgi:hypothetical protein
LSSSESTTLDGSVSGMTTTCDCGLPARHRGTWCHTCYERLRRTGRLEYLPRPSAEERFLAKVQRDASGCWVWAGALTVAGYGRFNAGGRGGGMFAHRWSYGHFRGSIPDGLTLDHLCRNPPCVNPDHLEPVTQGENNRRSVTARGLDAACSKGHPRSEAYVYQGKHQCRGCRRERWHERAADPAFLARHAAREAARKARLRSHPIHSLPERDDDERRHEARRAGDR